MVQAESPVQANPVTYIIKLTLKDGYRPQVDSMVFKQAGTPETFAGMSVIRTGSIVEMIYHFVDVAHLQTWLKSEDHTQLISEFDEACDHIETERVEGKTYYATHTPKPHVLRPRASKHKRAAGAALLMSNLGSITLWLL